MPLLNTDYKKKHIPVMVKEVIELLSPIENGTYVDATLGAGGHSLEILKKLNTQGRLIGIDRDHRAIEIARHVLDDQRVELVKAKFSQLEEVLKSLNIEKINGIIFDLGVSMMQLKDFERGFSFHSESRLDMRMDTNTLLTAWDVVNTYSEDSLTRIFREYGDEVYGRKIAKAIVNRRQRGTIDTCKELAELISSIVPRRSKIHPATKVFQAIRIEVNREIDELKEGLAQATKLLHSGGRLCIISYHSVEDRIVKNFLREEEKRGNLRILTKKPLFPTIEEIRKNPSARSARLRGGEKK